ncbi:outer membrane beta-barrel protein [Roseivirga sp. BDSF3-8]|uniref:outer membrane beta-barrel protein n=1 Tax=Roseivirga sp. BDSF3-8 TaxID=3241598 RepID=UPI003531E5B0
MKKLLLLFSLLLLSQAGFSQISQGYKYVSGTVMYNTDRFETYRTHQVTVMPEINFMTGDYFSIGLAAGLVHEKYQQEVMANSPYQIKTTNLYGIAPKIKFFTPVGEKVYFSPEVSVPLLFGSTTDTQGLANNQESTTTYDRNRWGFNAGMGLVFVLGDRFTLEAKMAVINYMVDVQKFDSEELVEEEFDFGFDLNNAGLSVGYFF